MTAGAEQRPRRYHFDRWGLGHRLTRAPSRRWCHGAAEHRRIRSADCVSRATAACVSIAISFSIWRAVVLQPGLDRSIDTQVSRLRKKLELDPSDPKIIKTVWGGGYMFTPAVSRE